MLSFVLTSTLALVAGPAPVQAAPSRPPVVTEQVERRLRAADSLVASWVEAQRIPGALLLVSKGDDVLLERAYGSTRVHDYGGGQYRVAATGGARSQGIRPRTDASPVTRETVFDLASVTKVMATTFAVMLSVDRGELDLDAPVHTYLPDFRGGGKDAITIRHLLTHRAGLQPSPTKPTPTFETCRWRGTSGRGATTPIWASCSSDASRSALWACPWMRFSAIDCTDH